MANEPTAIPATIRSELRRTISIVILDYVYTNPPMKKLDLEQLMFDCFHGNEEKEIASQMRRLVLGAEPFDQVYESVDTPVTNANSSTAATSDVTKLFVKHELVRTDKRIMAGQHISEVVLQHTTFKNSAKVSGRSLLSMANDTLRTVKKALAIAQPMLDSDGSVKASGMTADDVVETVRKQMYVLLKGKRTIDESELVGDDDAAEAEATEEQEGQQGAERTTQEEQEVPEHWFFAGYVPFLLFGPFAPDTRRLGVLVTDKEMYLKHSQQGKGGKQGRSAFRERDAAENAAAAKRRKKDEDGTKCTARAVKGPPSLADRVAVANLDFRRHEHEKRKKDKRKERQLIAMKFQLDALKFRIESAERRGKHAQLEMLDEEYESTYAAIKGLAADSSPESLSGSHKVPLLADRLVTEVGAGEEEKMKMMRM